MKFQAKFFCLSLISELNVNFSFQTPKKKVFTTRRTPLNTRPTKMQLLLHPPVTHLCQERLKTPARFTREHLYLDQVSQIMRCNTLLKKKTFFLLCSSLSANGTRIFWLGMRCKCFLGDSFLKGRWLLKLTFVVGWLAYKVHLLTATWTRKRIDGARRILPR